MNGHRLNLLRPVLRLPKDLQLLFWSFFLWSFGYGLYNFVWPLFLEGLNADPSQVGLVFSIGFVALAACMIPGGILANKYDLKVLLIIGWVMSLPPMIMYYYARTWTDVIPGIVLLQLSGFNVPAFNAYIAGASERQKTGSSFGIVWASAPFGAVLSPAVGGALLAWISIRQIFLLSLAFFIVSTIVLFGMRTQPPEARDRGLPKLEVPRTKPEIMLLVFLAGAAVAFSIAAPFLPLFFHDILSLSPGAILGLGSIQALGQTAFAIFLGRRADLRSRGQTMALGLILAAVGLVGIIATRNVLLAIPLIFFFGSARASSYIAYSVLATTRSGQSRAGQYGFYLTLEALGFVAGSYLGGILYSVSAVSGFVTAIGLWLVLALVAGVTSFKVKEPLNTVLPDETLGH
jgi:MFS family permease